MIPRKEWNALTEEERIQRRKAFRKSLLKVLRERNAATIGAAVEATLRGIKKGGTNGG